MTRLRETIEIERPPEQAQAALEEFFALLCGGDGISRLRLRVPVDGATRKYGIYLDREVVVEAHRARDEENLNDVIRIAWLPEGAMVFPRFAGSVAICGQDDPARSYVELDGSYAPPFGAAGQLFDATIGRQIAQATARELLKDLKAAIEGAP